MYIQNIKSYTQTYQYQQKPIQFKANEQNPFAPTPKSSKEQKAKYIGIATALTLIPVGIFAIYKSLKRGKTEPLTGAIGEIQKTFTNKKGEKIIIEYKDNIIQKATKYFADGSIAHVKNYTTDESGKKIITTLKPNTDGTFSLDKIAEHTKETNIQYSGEDGFITKYIRKFGNTWKDLTPYISQEKVRVPRATTMYLECGMDINRFLRSGEFYNHQFRNKRIPMEIPDDNFKAYTLTLIKEAKEANRRIIDSIDNLDIATQSSRTTEPMVVYRDAPTAWLDTAKDGKLVDRGYCSTSTERGASMEGMLSKEPTMTYEIELDANMPFLDLTHTTEKEMLLPRNLEFEIIGPNRLRCLGPISE
jgi:hypothetical protein